MTSPDACPKCSHPAAPGAVECPACGIVYAKYRGPAAARPAAAVAGTAGDVFNPYAPPESELTGPTAGVYTPAAAGEVWRLGDLLVMAKGASLPDRCVRCNGPVDVRLRRKLSWHRPWIFLTILISVLVYLIIALIVRKKAELEVPLCAEHERQRKNRVGMAWIVVLASVAMGIVGLASPDYVVLLALAPFVFLVGLILGAAASQPVVPKKIDDRHVWLRKVSPAYLAGLPPAPSHLGLG